MNGALLKVEGLEVHFPVKMGVIQEAGRWLVRRLGGRRGDDVEPLRPVVHAVDGVSFSLRRGEILGLVGESGCGKTTTGRAVLRLIRPTGGTIRFEDREVTDVPEKELRSLRPRMQPIFQDPHAALNPAMTLGRSIEDPLLIHQAMTEEAAHVAAARAMTEVGLVPPKEFFDKYPADLSGGQKQRAVIARAMILKPSLVVADEPVAMLDMSIRAKILELLLELRTRYNLGYLFITHDLATARFVCDRIAIMYLGRIVEIGPARQIFEKPMHPYTKALIAAIPVPEPGRPRTVSLPHGEVPDAVFPPAGCRFHPRCPVALPTCGWEGRDFVALLEERWLSPDLAACEAAAGPPEAWESDGPVVRRDVKRGDEGAVRGLVGGILKEAGGPMAQAVHDIRAEDPPPPDWGPAVLYGLLAAILGGTVWGVIEGLWGYILGIVVFAVGVGVATAVHRGARRVTPAMIGLGVLLTMFGAFIGDVIGLTIGLWRLGHGIPIMDVLAAYPLIVAAAPVEAAVVYGFGFLGAFVAAYRLYRKMKDSRSIVVEFRPPDPLGPREVEGRTVECLLY